MSTSNKINGTVFTELYEPHLLLEACEKARSGESVRKVSKEYGVPRRTLRDHLHGKVKSFDSYGPSRMLTIEEEAALLDYILYMNSHNFPLGL